MVFGENIHLLTTKAAMMGLVGEMQPAMHSARIAKWWFNHTLVISKPTWGKISNLTNINLDCFQVIGMLHIYIYTVVSYPNCLIHKYKYLPLWAIARYGIYIYMQYFIHFIVNPPKKQ